MIIEFESVVWQWGARADSSWFFATVPEELSEEIREIPRMPRGFGSVRVRARIGGSEWTTSIFPDKESGTYSLPLKKAVRDAESLAKGDTTVVRLDVLDG